MSGSRSARKRLVRSVCEGLESRRLLSTINWINRGIDDNFGIFGANANQARLTVDRAILDWSEVILNFNHAGAGNTFNLTVRAADLGGTARGTGGPRAHDGERVPTSGELTIDDNAGNGAAGWYFDPVLGDDGEFNQVRGWWSAGTSIPGSDFYYVVLHEIGHCLGISSNPTYLMRDFMVDTGANDPNDGSDLLAVNVNGGPIEATFTSGAHLYEGPAIPGRPDIPIHPEDLMNPGRTVPTNTNRRILISDADVLVLRDVYQYTVRFPNTINNMMVNPNFTTDVLTVAPVPGPFNDTIVVQGGTVPGTLHVSVGPFSEIVPLAQTNRIEVVAGGGNDITRIEYNGGRPTVIDGGDGDDIADFAFATRNLSNITGPTTVRGGNGNDSIFAYDNANPNFDSYLINTVGFNRTGFVGFGHQPDVEHFTLTTGTNHNPVNIPLLSATPKVYLHSAGGQDLVNIGGGTAGMSGILGDIEVQNNPSFTTINIDDRGSSAPRLATIDQASAQFGYLAGIAPGTVYWDNADIQDIFVTTGGGDDAINLRACSEVLALENGGGGADWVTVLHAANGAQSVTGSVRVNGSASGAVTNLVVDNTPATANRTISVAPAANGYNQITGLSPAAIQYRNVAKLILRGGQGNDAFTLTSLKDDDVTVDGRGGFDTLVVDDRNLLVNMTDVLLYPDRVTRLREATPVDPAEPYTVFYQATEELTVHQPARQLVTQIFGTPATIAPFTQVSLLGQPSGNYHYALYPRDAQGNLTINGTLGIGGSDTADTLTINDTASSLPIHYRFHNPFGAGTTNIAGLGSANFGAASNIESIVVNAGGGDDSFTIDTFRSGSSLTLRGNGGSDSVNWTPAARDTVPNVTAMSSFTFDGGAGHDYLNFFNDNNPSAWTYSRTNALFAASRIGGATYFLNLNDPNVETLYATGGAGADQIAIQQVRSGGEVFIDGAAGNDQFVIGAAQRTQDIRGLVGIYTNGGTDSVTIDDRADTTGRTFHVGAGGTVGAAPGDDLFGPGGRLAFGGVAALAIRCGSGADRAYVAPQPSTSVNAELNNPAQAPGDSIGFALAGATNPQHIPGAPGAGQYLFANRAAVNYSGAESTATDAVAPLVNSSSFEVNLPRQAVRVAFSEDVSTSLQPASVTLRNLTTNQTIPAADIALSYDAAMNTASFTFPNFASGVLPDGNYRLTLAAGAVSDLYGNPTVAEHVLNFFFLQGDATRDGRVNLQDFNRLAANFGRTNATFSHGDFNYDGRVNLQDFNLLAGRFGTMLGASASSDVGLSRSRARDLIDQLLA